MVEGLVWGSLGAADTTYIRFFGCIHLEQYRTALLFYAVVF